MWRHCTGARGRTSCCGFCLRLAGRDPPASPILVSPQWTWSIEGGVSYADDVAFADSHVRVRAIACELGTVAVCLGRVAWRGPPLFRSWFMAKVRASCDIAEGEAFFGIILRAQTLRTGKSSMRHCPCDCMSEGWGCRVCTRCHETICFFSQ